MTQPEHKNAAQTRRSTVAKAMTVIAVGSLSILATVAQSTGQSTTQPAANATTRPVDRTTTSTDVAPVAPVAPVVVAPVEKPAAAIVPAATVAPVAPAIATTPAPVRTVQAEAPAPAGNANRIVAGQGGEGVFEIHQNKSRVISTTVPYKRINVSQPEIADVNAIGPKSILVTAKKPGQTQIILWDDQDQSEVVEVNVVLDLRELQEKLNQSLPGSAIEVATSGDAIVVRGRVRNLQQAEQAMMIAEGHGARALNLLEISGGQQVMLRVRFAEVSRTASNSLGFSGYATDGTTRIGVINGGLGDPIGAMIPGSGTEGTIDTGVNFYGAGSAGAWQFEYFLSALRQNNLLRVLAEPNLVTMSGQPARFLAGGEFPIPVPQGGSGGTTITIEYKEFGIQLNFIPTVLGDGRIRLKVAPEVSDLDFSNAVTLNGFRIPALTTRNVDTMVELHEGQTLAIAGLLNTRVQANRDVTPLLGDIPVLGALFRSVRYERKETELVVLVTPVLVEAMNPSEVPALPGERWREPSETELFLFADIGAEQKQVQSKKPAPAYQGAHGFTPAAATQSSPTK